MATLVRSMIGDTPTNKRVVRISQFNVLAHSLSESGGFEVSDPKVLTWDYRRTLYKDILLNIHFDIMCFEEVDSVILTELKAILEPLGFLHIWHPKFYTKPDEPYDGTVIFYNKKLFKLNSYGIIQYRVDNRLTTQFAAIMSLESISESVFSVCLAATHLKARPGYEQVRLSQVKQLTSEIFSYNPRNYPVIICGDFNDTPDSLACQKMIKYFKSAYTNENSSWTTCKKRQELVKRVIDYIFHDDKLKCVQTLNIPEGSYVFPSELYPSDHLMIGATFIEDKLKRPKKKVKNVI